MTVHTPVELTRSLTDAAFYAGDPFPTYRRLRNEAPIAWNDDIGFWALSKHSDVVRVSRDPSTFCSGRGVLLMDLDRELPDVPGALLYIDPPEHQRYRKLVNPGFGSARVRALEDDIRRHTGRVLDAIELGTPVDLVTQVSVPIPLLVIADLLGVPGDDYPRFHEWSDAIIAAATGITEETAAAGAELAGYLMAVIEERRRVPRDDLISLLVSVTVDGDRLSDDELMMFCIQLLVAGNETTRNLFSSGLVALAEHPEQWKRLVADRSLVPAAIEELLRWSTPVISFLRTATRDVELRGLRIREGEPVLLLYSSANRDEEVFGPTSEQLDVARHPNNHVAFGFGEHFCLGAPLARLEARVFLEELLERFSYLELAGEVERLQSTVIAGVLHVPMVFRR